MTLTDPDRAPSPPGEASWPVWSGDMPPVAGSFSARPETGPGYLTGLPAGQAVLLAGQGQQPAAAGGTGKTQLAAAVARSAWQAGEVHLLAWVTASSRDAVLTGYAQAFGAIGAHDASEDPETAAARFVAWLAQTSRPWLVVLDDLADLADLDGLWPRGPAGRVVVTTRLPADELDERHGRVAEVGPFSPREAVNYLAVRLAGDPDQRIGVLDLAEDLGGLPLALEQAASVMADCGIGCREYRQSYASRQRQVAGLGGGPGAAGAVSATWLLSLDRAGYLPPAGLAWPAAAFVALLGADGIPQDVLASQAACDFICGSQGGGAAAQRQVRDVLANLARVALVSIDPGSAAHTVRMHALIGAVIRPLIQPALLEQAARAAADALLQAWPQHNLPPDLAQAMRACAAALHQSAGDLLWSPDGHPVLLRTGQSLDSARLAGPAVGYWRELAATSDRILGPEHASTLLAGDKLAAALEAAGRPQDAIEMYEQALADRARVLGWNHVDALAARSRLAQACQAGGRYAEAISLQQSTLAGREWALGAAHPDTLASRRDLALAYRAAGRLDEAVTAFTDAVRACEIALGASHPDTLAVRADLAATLQAAGRLKEAVSLAERVLRDRERDLGAAHPDTTAARASLAYAYRSAGRLKDALPLYKRTLADRERVLGPDHADTLAARGNLASAYHSAGKLKEAISLYEQTLAGREKVQGDDHPDTLAARGNLASAYHSAGKMVRAIPLYERTLAEYARVKGPDHPDTLTSRANLASAYHTVGRLTDAITSFRQTLADCERALPAGHPLTEAIRENLEAASQG